MPPKKKGGGRRLSRRMSRKAVIVDGIPLSEMTKEQLEEHSMRLREELELEREERNFFQSERDSVTSFWDLQREELKEKGLELLRKDRDMGNSQERHQVEVAICKQKVKHLLFEQEKKIAELEAQHQVALKKAESDRRISEQELGAQITDLKEKIRIQQLDHLTEIRRAKLEQADRLSEALIAMETRVEKISDDYESKLDSLRKRVELRREEELQEMEERKDFQLLQTEERHTVELAELKAHHADVTQNNLALINTMKEELAAYQLKGDQLERQLSKALVEKTALQVPLAEAWDKLKSANAALTEMRRERFLLKSAQDSLQKCKDCLKAEQMENETLRQKFSKLDKERKVLRECFISAIQEIQQKCGLSAALTESKLRIINNIINQSDN